MTALTIKSDKSYFIKSISPNLIQNYKDLEYINKPFSDKNTIEKWKSIGHNYQRYTGLMFDQSNTLPEWCYKILDYIPLNKSTITLYCMEPGIIMPEHSDTFSKYREIMNLSDNDNVGRAIIFLEDWNSGHYFELNGLPIVNWKSGDYVLWKNDTPHIAANLGKENRYTMQITGIYNDGN
jgi:hypothetical protein